MITVLPVKDKKEIEKLFNENNICVSENSAVTVAKDGEVFLGYCLFEIDDRKIIILQIIPQSDVMLADGILRAALHIADFRGITEAYYSEGAPVSLFKKLDFIKNEEEMSLKIEKLHQSSCCCQKNNK